MNSQFQEALELLKHSRSNKRESVSPTRNIDESRLVYLLSSFDDLNLSYTLGKD